MPKPVIPKKAATPVPKASVPKTPPRPKTVAKVAKPVITKKTVKVPKTKIADKPKKTTRVVPKQQTDSQKKPKNLQKRFEFLEKHLNNSDDYFRLNFSVDLLLEIFNVLIKEEKVSVADVEKFVQSARRDYSFKDIFDYFGVKQD